VPLNGKEVILTAKSLREAKKDALEGLLHGPDIAD